MDDQADGFDEVKHNMFSTYQALIAYIHELDDDTLKKLLREQINAFEAFFLFMASTQTTNELIEKLGKK